MKRLLGIVAAVLAFASGVAHAHTHLESSMPADKAVLEAAPAEIMLHFSEATRLTALTIQKDGEKEKTAISVLPKTASVALKVPLEPLSPGKYTVNWRALGGDNHVMSGDLHFTIKGK